MTLDELAKRVNLPFQTISRYELEQRVPKIDIATNIAQSLGINPLWLQGFDVGINDPMPKSAIDDRLDAFSSLSSESQKAVLDYMEYLATKEAHTK